MTLQDDLAEVLNRHSAEDGSNTPDRILARYVQACLAAFNIAVRERAGWYGRMDKPGAGGRDGMPTLGAVSDDGPGTYEGVPTAIEAIRWTGHNKAELDAFAPGKTGTSPYGDGMQVLAGVDGAQGWVDVPVGHWLVHKPGDLSDVWPVEDGYFREKYREVRT